MKKIFLLLFTVLILSSCSVVYGPNMEKRAQQLELGMTKQEAVRIMGDDYFIESVSQTVDGKVEILHFRSTVYYSPYLLYFIDGILSEFHRYVPPTPLQQEIHVVRQDPNKI